MVQDIVTKVQIKVCEIEICEYTLVMCRIRLNVPIKG